jgi:hypothetical protein
MKPARALLALAVSLAAATLTPAACAENPSPDAPTVASTPLLPADSIRVAADPSAAVQAYAAAQQADPGNTQVELAYVRRMVDFGLPEMADSQAQALVKRHSTDGLPWAVSAYMMAKRQDTPAALTQIAYAASIAGKEPFVIRTAAQILAWYDLRIDKAKIPAEAQTAALTTRTLLSDKPEYQQAYTRAAQAYTSVASNDQPAPESPATQNVTPAPAQQTASAAPVYAPEADEAVYAGPYYYAPDYYTPVGYAPTYCAPWWPVGYDCGAFWWPNFGDVIVIDNFASHRHFRDGFRDHDRDGFRNHDRDGFHDGPSHGVADGRGSFLGRGRDGTWTHSHDASVATPLGTPRSNSFAPARNFAGVGRNSGSSFIAPTHSSMLVPHAGTTFRGAGSPAIGGSAATPAAPRSSFNWNTVRSAELPRGQTTFQRPIDASPRFISPAIHPAFSSPSLRAAPMISRPTFNSSPAPRISAPSRSFSPAPHVSAPMGGGGMRMGGGGSHGGGGRR